MSITRRHSIEPPHEHIEFESAAGGMHVDAGAHLFVRDRTADAIGLEGIDRPFAGRREIELVVAWQPLRRDESFETGVLPELRTDARRDDWRRNSKPGNVSVHEEGDSQLSAWRSADNDLDAAHCFGKCQGMALEADG